MGVHQQNEVARRIANRLIVENAVLKAPSRPLALSTQATFTSWATLVRPLLV